MPSRQFMHSSVRDSSTSQAHRSIRVEEYLAKVGPVRPYGFIFGFQRDIPHPRYPDEHILLQRLTAALRRQIEYCGGVVLRSPLDVILDTTAGLVLHPPIAVVMSDRLGALQEPNQVWGPPHVVMELLCPATARRIRCHKLRWYQHYGIDECWLIDTRCQRIEVLDFCGWSCSVPYIFSGTTPVESRGLGQCSLTAAELFTGCLSSAVRPPRGAPPVSIASAETNGVPK